MSDMRAPQLESRSSRRTKSVPSSHPRHLIEPHEEFESRRVSLALRSVGLSLLAVVVLLWTFVYQMLIVDVSVSLPPGVSNEAFEYAIYQTENGRMLGAPAAVDISADGDLYVLDSAQKCVHIYDSEQRFVRSYGIEVPAKYKLRQPVSIAVASSGQSYVVDSATKQLVIYDSDGKPVRAVTFKEEQPLSVSVGLNENAQEIIYVTTKSGIALGSLNGAFYAGRFSWGRQPGQFDAPVAVSVDSAGDKPVLYVVDSLNYRIQAISGFETTPTVKWVYGGPLEGDGIKNQSASRKFGLPVDAELGVDNTLYVLDGLSGQLVVLNRETGRLVDAVASMGKRDGELQYPEGVAAYGGKIYVADTDNARISVYREGGLVTPSPDDDAPTAQWGWIAAIVLAVLAFGQIMYTLSMRRRWIIVGPDVLDRLDSSEYATKFEHLSPTVVLPLAMGSLASIVKEPLSVHVQAVRSRVAEKVIKQFGDMYEPSSMELLALIKYHRNSVLVTDDESLIEAARLMNAWAVHTEVVLGGVEVQENSGEVGEE